RRVDRGREGVEVAVVLERLDAAGGRAGADRDQGLRLLANLPDPRRVVLRRHRALDERHVVGALGGSAPSLEEVGDLDLARDGEQLVLAVEQRELAAVAGGELPDRERGLRHSSRTSISSAIAAAE